MSLNPLQGIETMLINVKAAAVSTRGYVTQKRESKPNHDHKAEQKARDTERRNARMAKQWEETQTLLSR